jgi:hypothetical protein
MDAVIPNRVSIIANQILAVTLCSCLLHNYSVTRGSYETQSCVPLAF